MGFLTRMLVPRGVRRAAHPVRTAKSAVTPRPIKQARRALNPIDSGTYAIERKLNTKPRKRGKNSRAGKDSDHVVFNVTEIARWFEAEFNAQQAGVTISEVTCEPDPADDWRLIATGSVTDGEMMWRLRAGVRCYEDGSWKFDGTREMTDWTVVRERAAEGPDILDEVGREMLRPMVEMLRDPDVSKRQAAASALADNPSENARAALTTALKDPDLSVHFAALKGLVALGGDDVVRLLRGELQDAAPFGRQRAVRMLGEIGSEEALDAVRSALGDSSPSVRGEAERTLARISSEKDAGRSD